MKEKVFRIVSKPAINIELALNELADDYSPIVWNITPIDGVVFVTCVLMNNATIRQAAIAQAGWSSKGGLFKG